MSGESINRTRWTVTETELGLVIAVAVQHLLVLSFADLCFPERGTAENFSSRCSSWLLLVTRVEAEAWLSCWVLSPLPSCIC